jgi:parallel beta-helix repeat protein
MKSIASAFLVTLILVGTLIVILDLRSVQARGTIYIRADGSINPATANLTTADHVTYTFTGEVDDSIVVERDNIVLDGRGFTLQGNGSGRGIEIIDRHNVTVRTVVVTNFDYGIWAYSCRTLNITGNTVTASNWMAISIHYSHDCRLDQNNVTRNRYGIWLPHSFSNSAADNIVVTNEFYGFYVDHESFNNTLLRNTMSHNQAGIYLAPYSENNTVAENHITQNDIGVHINRSPNNLFAHNTFANPLQIWNYANYSSNHWDAGYPAGGNYWSDYIGVDEKKGTEQNETGSDGIGDTPYILDETNQDRYPLMQPWAPSPPGVPVAVKICPPTLTLRGRGRWLTAFITLPAGYTRKDVNVSAILLNHTVPAAMRFRRIHDCGGEETLAVLVRFDRTDVLRYVLDQVATRRKGITVTLTITGTFKDGTPFQGSDTIRIVKHFHPPRVCPHGKLRVR